MIENTAKKIIVALCYDFDKTLCPKDMQEYALFDKLRINASQFWELCDIQAKNNGMDKVLSYMKMTVEMAARNEYCLTKSDFFDMGKQVELYQGVQTWFNRINTYAEKLNINLEHYIISAGQQEIIEGVSIAKYIKAIFASEFVYNQNENPIWPKRVVNYTQKTQYMYRINKGALDLYDEQKVNLAMPHDQRRVPFRNMIYIGDSYTDIPAMSLLSSKGGFAIGVYNPVDDNTVAVKQLLMENRISFFAPADYRKGSKLELLVTKILDNIKAKEELFMVEKQQKVAVVDGN
ncbi:MAG: haloacid dehalogenase-like hydrolase [Clostridiales bacterium]|jgi:hypothetical protein|nr:haloacid dehalogenase-like hydrolase [Clostridiales bacterium]